MNAGFLLVSFLSITIVPFHQLKGPVAGMDRTEGMLKDLAGGDPEFGGLWQQSIC